MCVCVCVGGGGGVSRAGSQTGLPLQWLRRPVNLARLDGLFYGHGAQLPLTLGFFRRGPGQPTLN